jgi:hypothetical protein
MAEPFELHAPKRNMMILGVLGLVMTALSALPLWLWLSGRSDPEDLAVFLPIGFVGTVFFGIATWTMLVRVLSPFPVIRVDAEGLHVWRYPSMSWDEFAYADAQFSSREKFLVLHTNDDAAFRDRMVWYRRTWAKGNAALIEGAVYLSERMLPLSADELAGRINEMKFRDRPG